ncbi:MAG: hypothetical protein O9284_00085 [Steroidobacteraceae bacterium]|jgi:hypothetical protein|nr:hypothetical protein [Steroidobacteraceae bacterium]
MTVIASCLPFVRVARAALHAVTLVACAMLPVAQALAQARPSVPPKVCVGDPPVCVGTPARTASTGRIKWNPGHYMNAPTVSDPKVVNPTQLADEPYVKGMQQRYWWATLEPERGRYDFSIIDGHLAVLKPMGKRLVIQIMDRSWSGTSATGRLPAYLGTPEFNGGWYVKPNSTGVVARIWEKPVMDRLIALYEALGKRYDGEVYVEGITTEETSIGFSPGGSAPSSYNRPALAAQLKRLVTGARRAWPNSNVFVYTNFLTGEIEGIIEHVAAERAAPGGPDVLPPPHRGAEGDRIIQGLVGGTDYRGKLAIGYAVQSPALCGKEGCWEPSVLADHAVNTLGATHVFWTRLGTHRDTPTLKVSWDYGILPAIRAIRGRTNTACPSVYQGACATGGS